MEWKKPGFQSETGFQQVLMLILSGQENRLGVKQELGDKPTVGDGKQVRLFAPGVKRDEAIKRLKEQSFCTPNMISPICA